MYHKYRAKKTIVDGQEFPSKLEGATFSDLKLLVSAGVYSNVRKQVPVTLMVPLTVKLDFVVFDNELQEDVYVEAKGVSTERWSIFKRQWKKSGPGRLRIYGGSYMKPKMAEEIIPKGEK